MIARALSFSISADEAAPTKTSRLWPELTGASPPATGVNQSPPADVKSDADPLPAKSGSEDFAASILDAIEAARRDHDQHVQSLESRFRKNCVDVLARIVSAAAPAIIEAAARDAIAKILSEASTGSLGPTVRFAAAPDLHAACRSVLEREVPPELLIVDAGLPTGTMKIRWEEGGADIDAGRSLFAIVNFLKSSIENKEET